MGLKGFAGLMNKKIRIFLILKHGRDRTAVAEKYKADFKKCFKTLLTLLVKDRRVKAQRILKEFELSIVMLNTTSTNPLQFQQIRC